MSEKSRKTARTLEGWGTLLCIGGFVTFAVSVTDSQSSGGWALMGFLAGMTGLVVFVVGRFQD